uniref:MHC class I-like antigen recognition-like domain-containing protein n=1 Tax=Terrapene triunguis TaxID=2587831 RepID=A0A674INP5_9SAUR
MACSVAAVCGQERRLLPAKNILPPGAGAVYSLISLHTRFVLHLFPAPASPPLPPVSVTLRLLQIDVFHNASSTDMQGMALLGDLETHSMNCSTCEIHFLQPWAQQGLTPKQWQDLELLIHRYLFNFNRTVNRIAQQQGKGYPFVTQVSLGCELPPNGSSRGFYDAAVNGEDFISFDMDGGKWVARQEDNVAALYTRDLLNQDKGTRSTIQFLLSTTCVSELKSFVQHGNESLERQGEAGHHLLPCSHLWGRVCLLFIQGSRTQCSYAATSGLRPGGCLYRKFKCSYSWGAAQ